MSVELVIVAAILFGAMIAVCVLFYQVGHGLQLVGDASASAARAASLAPDPAQARTAAEQSAHDTLAQAGRSCTRLRVDVDTGEFVPGGVVRVQVTCTADLSGLLPGLPGTRTMSSVSTEQLEPYRQLG